MIDQKQFEMLSQLRGLMERDPEKLKAMLLERPDIAKLLLQLKEQYAAASSVTVAGFKLFYREVYLRELPAVAESIAEAFVWAFAEKKGAMQECWRGFGKSTFLTAWAAYIVGARPVGSTALVRINDKAAQKTGATIAEMIETNPGWKKIFPHVVPDKEAGWSGENGYHVMDLRVVEAEGRDKWLQLCFADHVSEPTLACGGIESGIIIGMHPSNGMWFDDLHDEGNTRSKAEMEEVVAILEGNLISTWFGMGGSPAIGVACTPWSEKDAYVRMMQTGIFKKVSIPIFVREGLYEAGSMWEKNFNAYGVEYFEPYDCNVVLTAPKEFPMEKVMEMYLANPNRFGQMYLLDLSTLKGKLLLRDWLNEYPADKISDTWPCYFGIDFASTTDKLKGESDYFALAIGRAIPGGGIVVTGGYRDRVSMQVSLAKIQALAALYNPSVIAVERWGKGEEFLSSLLYSTSLPVLGLPVKGAPVKSKGQRFETGLGTSFANGRMWVSSAKDQFLKAFEEEWVAWDGRASSGTRHDDTLDAVYWLMEVALGHVMQVDAAGKPERKERGKSPLAGIGSYHGYGV